MALINCPDCGTEVSDAAAACPKCARPIAAAPRVRPSSSAQTKGVSAGFAALVFLALGGWIYYQATTPDQSSSANSAQVSSEPADTTSSGDVQLPQASVAPKRPVFTTTPADLYRAYSINEVATDQALAGKVIQFTAPVESIDKDFTDSAVLRFATGDELTDLQATLKDSDKAAAAQLSPGQIITVRCDSFRRIMDSPMGDDCTFQVGSERSTAGNPVTTPQSASTAGPDVAAAASAAAAAATAAQVATENAPAVTPDSSTPDSDNSVSPAPQTVAATAVTPSFDCSKATKPTSITICSNTGLSQLDQQMASLYSARVQSDPAVRDAQRAWLQSRDQCGADVICLRKEYAARIQQLQQ